ncbi:MAG: hypothetical protein EAZ36_01715 [Verrucomicrobia bacterium]|nr:MAG: hypothetical protein EAZ36_01715 [Verrucomicrobiota bacterium]
MKVFAIFPALALLSLLALPVSHASDAAEAEAAQPTPLSRDAPAPPLLPEPPERIDRITLTTLVVGSRVFRDVRVQARDSRSLFFSHREGLGSVRLRDLPADLQLRLRFDPATAPPDVPPPRFTPPAPAPRVRPAEVSPRVRSTTQRLERLFMAYADVPVLYEQQSLQDDYIRLNVGIKNQGRRPSCSVFAIVSALEFQNAQLTGQMEKLSEEYLIWATRRSLGLTGPDGLVARASDGEPLDDAGYSLPSVISALQTFGIPNYDDMPNQLAYWPDNVPSPSDEVMARARERRMVFISPLPGRDAETRVLALIHALNEGFPVPAGLRWPHWRTIPRGMLTTQRPLEGAAHAITFIGYQTPTGRLEDTVFLFKNSYGPRWGQGGYGRATWAYLANNLLDAYVLDVRTRN